MPNRACACGFQLKMPNKSEPPPRGDGGGGFAAAIVSRGRRRRRWRCYLPSWVVVAVLELGRPRLLEQDRAAN